MPAPVTTVFDVFDLLMSYYVYRDSLVTRSGPLSPSIRVYNESAYERKTAWYGVSFMKTVSRSRYMMTLDSDWPGSA